MVEDEKQAVLRRKIEYQVACEEKAFRIVERLIENPIQSDWFIDALQFITPNHYKDVVEERAVAKLCGYPLCPNQLGKFGSQIRPHCVGPGLRSKLFANFIKLVDVSALSTQRVKAVPSQKYFISTRTNKVYDIEERKNFCNGRCFKASQYVEKQISSEPVWSRKKQPRKKIELLPLDMKAGKVGEEVQISARDETKAELKKLERLDHYQQALEDLQNSNIANNQQSRRSDDIGDPSNIAGSKSDSTQDLIDSNSEGVKSSNKDETAETNHEEVSRECVYSLDKALSELGISEQDLETDKRTNTSIDSSSKPKPDSSSRPKPQKEPVKKSDKDVEKTGKSIGESKQSGKEGHSERLKRKSEKSSQQAKTDYLMKLLDKKKSLLAKMADIQQTGPEHEQQITKSSNDLLEDKQVNEPVHRLQEDSTVKLPSETIASSKDFVTIETNNINSHTKDVVKENSSQKVSDEHLKTKTSSLMVTEHSIEEIKSTKVRDTSKQADAKPPVNVSVLHIICGTLKSWVTKETVRLLLKTGKEDGGETGVQDKAKFEKQYRALVAKVDAQEREFSSLIGEETLEEDQEDRPTAPAPHFEVLRQEMAENQLRVREFMKGTFTYRPDKVAAHKEDNNQPEVVLPTVDKYDQMLIRQRIVLDRIHKVLPDVLSPLQLPMGDVFTDIRQLVETFNLQRENILFRPGEWTLIALILVKMASRKHTKIASAFTSPSAEKYMSILLRGIKTDQETLQQQIEWLLQGSLSKERNKSIQHV